MRYFFDATAALRRPEVEKDRLASERGKRDRFASIVTQRKVRCLPPGCFPFERCSDVSSMQQRKSRNPNEKCTHEIRPILGDRLRITGGLDVCLAGRKPPRFSS